MVQDVVLVERAGRIATILFNNPPVNAASLRLLEALHKALDDVEHDSTIRCVILSGAGEKAFCAGADLSGGTDTFTLGLDEPMTDFGRLARLIRDCGVPVVGRINGDCVAGGMGLMGLCDLTVVVLDADAHHVAGLLDTAHDFDAERAVEIWNRRREGRLDNLLLSLERVDIVVEEQTAAAHDRDVIGGTFDLTDLMR